MADPMLPPRTKLWVLSSGKIGHEVNCLGVAAALGLEPQIKHPKPRRFFDRLAPYGPIDPREASHVPGSQFAPPFPDILLACGRITLPYLRHLKRASGGKIFTAFMQDPRWGRGDCDMIWVPEHDALRGANVLSTLTSPHHLRPAAMVAARSIPDVRLAALPGPRLAIVLGGPSGAHRFEPADTNALVMAAVSAAQAGYSVMVTPSRRTPPELLSSIAEGLRIVQARNVFVWDGTGNNPYVQMLAHAQAILVTGDSVNMLGEAASTGAPVHVYEPTGGSPKMTRFIDRLVETGVARRWRGQVESWSYQPLDATDMIARELAGRFLARG